MSPRRPATALAAGLVLLMLSFVSLAQAQTGNSQGAAGGQPGRPAAAPASGTMVVATREAPPFAMKGKDGEWSGLSIWLWDRVARELGIKYRFEEASLKDMIDGVADGRFGASVAAMTITPEREKVVDFTHPFISTGFGIAVRKTGSAWLAVLSGVFTWGFVQAVLALAALLGFVGLLFWLVERHDNPKEFGGTALRGIGSGFWFSAVTMTTVGYGDKAPRTKAGRVIALVWMFGAILIISTFTGMIASALTTDRLTGAVSGPNDLPNVSVGSVPGSSSEGWLTAQHVGFQGYASVEAGLAALARGDIDAFVYDKPLLQYRINNAHQDALTVLPGTFGRQDYGIALPEDSPLRDRVNVSLLQIIESDAWSDRLFKALGDGER
ncbi:transporter substrate-binding domain-containing protein [Jiella sp. M17.18]|uniref:transporter substrate-binding domain-containing protein n=1 Tax=Jiella sp. M17.18 TaxID=3234247 RepID=UPI0034DE9042